MNISVLCTFFLKIIVSYNIGALHLNSNKYFIYGIRNY